MQNEQNEYEKRERKGVLAVLRAYQLLSKKNKDEDESIETSDMVDNNTPDFQPQIAKRVLRSILYVLDKYSLEKIEQIKLRSKLKNVDELKKETRIHNSNVSVLGNYTKECLKHFLLPFFFYANIIEIIFGPTIIRRF